MSNKGLALVAVVVFVVYAAVCMWVAIPRMEDDLTVRCRTALRDNNLTVEGLSFRGRDATLTGPMESAELSRQAERIVAETDGVRSVVNDSQIAVISGRGSTP